MPAVPPRELTVWEIVAIVAGVVVGMSLTILLLFIIYYVFQSIYLFNCIVLNNIFVFVIYHVYFNKHPFSDNIYIL